MDDLVEKLATFRDEVAPPWDDARRERAFLGVGRMQRRRRLQRGAFLSLSATGLAAVCALAVLRPSAGKNGHVEPGKAALAAPSHNRSSEPVRTVAQTDVTLGAGARARLVDGSQVDVGAAGAVLVRANTPQQVRLDLVDGSARFDVIPNEQRQFVVSVDTLEVVVVGTAFEVARAGARVRVAVSHGKVRVGRADRWELVPAGESSWFNLQSEPLPGSEPAAVSGSGPSATKAQPRVRGPQPSAAVAPRPQPEPRADWRSLSRSGDYERAYELLAQGPQTVSGPEDLVAAADVARWSNHPEIAAKYLRSLLSLHPDSPQAALAAFTLGRVLLDSLGRPSQAAEVFASVQDLSPQDTVAEDALAREVEAWSKAGRAEDAYRKARLFQQRYAQSRRLRVVELYGGLRSP